MRGKLDLKACFRVDRKPGCVHPERVTHQHGPDSTAHVRVGYSLRRETVSRRHAQGVHHAELVDRPAIQQPDVVGQPQSKP